MSDNWIVPKEGYLDPRTPAEYLEALRRFVETGIEWWDELPDGDGVNGTPDDVPIMTKTDLFRIMQGCCQYALDNLAEFHKMMVTK